MDYMSIIAMALLEHLSEIFERMEKKIVKSKDLTPGNTSGSWENG
jgi:hypothetical protein